ncbi:MAG: sensor histidine kinase [Spirochaetales bacterium]
MRSVASSRSAYLFVSLSLLLLMGFLIMTSGSLREVDETRQRYELLTREWFLLRLAAQDSPARVPPRSLVIELDEHLSQLLNSEALATSAQLSQGLRDTIDMLSDDWRRLRRSLLNAREDAATGAIEERARLLDSVEAGLTMLQYHVSQAIRAQQRALEMVLYVLGGTILATIGIFWLVERESSMDRAAAIRVQSFAQSAIGTQEEERARIARALHDTLAQELSVILMQLSNESIDPSRLADVRKRLLDAVNWLRNLSYDLHPAEISQVGLGGALTSYCEEISTRLGVAIACDVADNIGPCSQSDAISLYRIGQEAVTNAIKHAGAAQISVSLRNEHSVLVLCIEDDGKGFSPVDSARRREGLGITGMQERAKLAGGELSIASAPGEGTRVTFRSRRIQAMTRGKEELHEAHSRAGR